MDAHSVPDIILIKNYSINGLTLKCLILEWRKLSHRGMKYPSQDFTLGKGGARVQILPDRSKNFNFNHNTLRWARITGTTCRAGNTKGTPEQCQGDWWDGQHMRACIHLSECFQVKLFYSSFQKSQHKDGEETKK